MAIFSRDGERDSEHRPKITRQFDTHNTVCMDKSSATIRPSASIWMSYVFTGHKISTKQKDRQVATNEQDRIVFQTIRKSCQHLVLSTKWDWYHLNITWNLITISKLQDGRNTCQNHYGKLKLGWLSHHLAAHWI